VGWRLGCTGAPTPVISVVLCLENSKHPTRRGCILYWISVSVHSGQHFPPRCSENLKNKREETTCSCLVPAAIQECNMYARIQQQYIRTDSLQASHTFYPSPSVVSSAVPFLAASRESLPERARVWHASPTASPNK